MKKVIGIMLPTVLLILFILIMLSASYLKQPKGEYDNIPQIVNRIKISVQNDNWQGAKTDIDKLSNAWKVISKRVQFSAERDELIGADTNIVRAKGFIEGKDKAGVLAEVNEVEDHWENLGR